MENISGESSHPVHPCIRSSSAVGSKINGSADPSPSPLLASSLPSGAASHPYVLSSTGRRHLSRPPLPDGTTAFAHPTPVHSSGLLGREAAERRGARGSCGKRGGIGGANREATREKRKEVRRGAPVEAEPVGPRRGHPTVDACKRGRSRAGGGAVRRAKDEWTGVGVSGGDGAVGERRLGEAPSASGGERAGVRGNAGWERGCGKWRGREELVEPLILNPTTEDEQMHGCTRWRGSLDLFPA